jgi:hypothetical protein
MNEKQQKILRIGLIIILLMGIFPPWTYTLNTDKVNSESPAGYALIFSPPETQYKASAAFGIKIDITRLIIQWVVVGAATFAFFSQARNKS